MIFVGATVVLAVTVASCSPGPNPAAPAGADTLSIERPGFPPNAPAVGDLAALVVERGRAALTYRGAPVVQACDLVTLDDITAAGLAVVGGTTAGLVERNYLERQGDATSRWRPRTCSPRTHLLRLHPRRGRRPRRD
ncbi:hypothetical protein GCM10009609_43660 [Pseudonocardia aurantiaca]